MQIYMKMYLYMYRYLHLSVCLSISYLYPAYRSSSQISMSVWVFTRAFQTSCILVCVGQNTGDLCSFRNSCSFNAFPFTGDGMHVIHQYTYTYTLYLPISALSLCVCAVPLSTDLAKLLGRTFIDSDED